MFNIISTLSPKLKPIPNIPRPPNRFIIKVNEPKSHMMRINKHLRIHYMFQLAYY